MSPHGRPKGERPRFADRRDAPGVHAGWKVDRRRAFARARTPVAVAMRVVADALAASTSEPGARRSVFAGTRTARRVAVRDTASDKAARPPRGCEDLH